MNAATNPYQLDTAAAATTVEAAWRSALAPPRKLSVSQWAESNLRISERYSAFPGPLRLSRCPYAREPIDAFGLSEVEEITLCWATQTAKSTMLQSAVAFSIVQDPAPVLIVYPTVDLARSISETRLQPLFHDCAAIAALMPDDKDLYKLQEMHFARCTLNLVGSNSPSQLAARPARILIMDETDKFAAATEKEADAESLVIERTTTFWNRKIVRASTPTTPNGKIWQAFLRGDQRYYFVPCPHCKQKQRLTLPQIKWPKLKDDNGNWKIEEVKRQAYYECCFCGERITDSHKKTMLQQGEWVATAPVNSHRSYHLSKLYANWVRFGDVAAEFLKSKPFPDALRNFINSWLAEPFEVQGEMPDEPDALLAAHMDTYPAKTCPTIPRRIILTADVQKDYFYYLVVGWGENETAFLMDYGTVGDMAALKEKAGTVYNACGHDVRISDCFIDSGYNSDAIYTFCAANNWTATKGHIMANLSQQPIKWGRVSNARLLNIATDFFKESLLRKLSNQLIHATQRKSNDNLPPFTQGAIHFHCDTRDDMSSQLTSETPVEEENRAGYKIRKWKKRRSRENHLLDCWVLQLAAATVLGLRYAGTTQPTKRKATPYQPPTRPDGRGIWDLR